MVFPQSTSLTSSQCDHGLQHLVTVGIYFGLFLYRKTVRIAYIQCLYSSLFQIKPVSILLTKRELVIVQCTRVT